MSKLFYPTFSVRMMKLRLMMITKMNLMLWSIYTRIPFRYGMYIAQYQCRFSEPLHYHHDGCPACYSQEVTDEDEFSGWYDENENQIDMWFYESGSYKDIGYEDFCLWLYDKVGGCRISDGGYWAPADGKPMKEHEGHPMDTTEDYPYNTEFGDGRTEEEMERIDRRK